MCGMIDWDWTWGRDRKFPVLSTRVERTRKSQDTLGCFHIMLKPNKINIHLVDYAQLVPNDMMSFLFYCFRMNTLFTLPSNLSPVQPANHPRSPCKPYWIFFSTTSVVALTCPLANLRRDKKGAQHCVGMCDQERITREVGTWATEFSNMEVNNPTVLNDII